MVLLGRTEILQADDLKTVDVEVPEWGGTVRLKMLTGTERDHFEASMVQNRGGKQKQNVENFRARLIALCAINEAGEKLFSPPDVKMLGGKSIAALQRLFNAANELNGLTEEDVDELTEGFEETPDEDSISD